jgi:RimJ/RimL family protein N-acetyltransferase
LFDVIDYMILRKVSFEDWKILLDWRNDVDTRKNSHHMEFIEEETHKEWLHSELANENCKFFIAIENEIPVGTVRAEFDKQNSEYELFWTVSPDFRGKGIGKIMVKLLVDKLQAKVKAQIKIENIASVKIAEYTGMKLLKEENGILYYSKP